MGGVAQVGGVAGIVRCRQRHRWVGWQGSWQTASEVGAVGRDSS
jgi:hypothetical protein